MAVCPCVYVQMSGFQMSGCSPMSSVSRSECVLRDVAYIRMLQCAGVYVRITVGGTGLGLLDTRCCLQGLKSMLQYVTTWGLWVCGCVWGC